MILLLVLLNGRRRGGCEEEEPSWCPASRFNKIDMTTAAISIGPTKKTKTTKMTTNIKNISRLFTKFLAFLSHTLPNPYPQAKDHHVPAKH